ncbi:MAG TPA: hypothetical protein VLQ45_23530 [Thermoanaerobaculia bacterium]|nr:hypothetical protein [Thermoanaerobaculia bacterium]
MAIEQNDRDQRDVSPVDAKTDVGPATGHAYSQHGVETGRIDREIGIRNILWAGFALFAVGLVVHLLIWGLLSGFEKMDDRRDVPLSPIEAASPQPEDFPMPRLQTTPEQDLRLIREEEDRLIGRAGWVDQQQGTMRVPLDVAIDVIAARGVDPGVVGGSPQGAPTLNPDQVRAEGLDAPAGRRPGATVQMTRPATPARPPAAGAADNQE